jgi:predicted AAA+ superfamily ATPase
MYNRTLNLKILSKNKSLFLFGPRSTGKTTLLIKQFQKSQIINLLKSELFLQLSNNPSEIRDLVRKIIHDHDNNPFIIIDEIQKLPILLDEVHELIESEKIKFILTGSSARKLKRSGVNLLGGRAWQAHLFPLTSHEITDFNLEKYLLIGGLPQVWTSDFPFEELDAYVNLYLKEEIKEEALVHNIIHFSRFLKTASLLNTQQINYAAVSQETGVPATTVKAYFEILDETFIGHVLHPWKESKKRKTVSSGKFYFFDLGVAHFLSGVSIINRNSDDFGKAFEHFICNELKAYLSYYRVKKELCFWRTQSKHEVDFIVGNDIAIEVKSTTNVNSKHLKGLEAIQEEQIIQKFFLVSFDKVERFTENGIMIVHWENFLKNLWGQKII